MTDTPRVLAPGFSSRSARRLWRRYARETRRPLSCLLYVVPLAGIHELALLWLRRGAGPHEGPLAQSMLHGLLAWFGFVGFWVPGVALLVSLLVWHRVRRDRWRIRLWVVPMMAVESLVLALPLLVLSGLFPQRSLPSPNGLLAELVRVLGAGVYEELVFRLLLISLLAWLVAEIAQLRGAAGLSVAVGLAAIIFAACHFQPIGMDPFGWGSFWFRLAAGVYLSVVYVGRGLGVSAGCHAAYNVLLVLLRSGS